MKLFKTNSRADGHQYQTGGSQRSSNYQAVGIRCGDDACAAVVELDGQRFLSVEAPMLPLSDCSRADRCQCRYIHYSDRRAEPRRKADGALPSGSHIVNVERRKGQLDRRSDWLDDADESEVNYANISYD